MREVIQRICATALAISVASFTPATAQDGDVTAYKSGNKMVEMCKETESYSNGFCLGYILGVTDMMSVRDGNVLCLPESSSASQIKAIVEKHWANHPEKLHYAAASNIYIALKAAFPCRK